MLLGQAFTALWVETTIVKSENNTAEEKAKKRVNAAYYELGCSINALRNKSGVGHGKPFISSITDEEAKAATESMGIIAEYLLAKLKGFNNNNNNNNKLY
ncbi:MAG: abortive infection family protein [Solibacillus sp.]